MSFRREKYVPRGGPDGGDGGQGGNVVFVVDDRLNTLSDFRRRRRFWAQNGENGRSKSQHGRSGKDLIIPVPPGTLVRDAATRRVLQDLTRPGERWIAARGGRGGKGNERFKSSTRQAPFHAQRGRPGQERLLELELKLIADVGLVGEPNAGKSTFLARVTNATPKIADYPFTTLDPVLGVCDLLDHRSLVLCDIPGLIEGAHKGTGMGHRFLKHIERTRVLLILIDITLGAQGVLLSYATLMDELKGYHEHLAQKPHIVALNKIDLLGDLWPEKVEETISMLPVEKGRCFAISAATGAGILELLEQLHAEVKARPSGTKR